MVCNSSPMYIRRYIEIYIAAIYMLIYNLIHYYFLVIKCLPFGLKINKTTFGRRDPKKMGYTQSVSRPRRVTTVKPVKDPQRSFDILSPGARSHHKKGLPEGAFATKLG